MKGAKMTRKETAKELQKIIERKRAWIEANLNDDEISIELREKLRAEVETEIAELEELIRAIENSSKTERRKSAAAAATAEREKRVKEKIQNAVNMLRMEQKEITPYQVAKMAGISYNTAKKYLNT